MTPVERLEREAEIALGAGDEAAEILWSCLSPSSTRRGEALERAARALESGARNLRERKEG